MITRRILLAGAAVTGAVAGLFGVRFLLAKDADAVVKVLRKRLDYLQLDDADVQRFADDLASRHPMSSVRLRTLVAAGPLYTGFAFSSHNFLADGIRHGEERVTTLFLLSSDFFINGSDASKPVRYLGYYDPVRPCGNPFARPVTQSDANA
jgi:hypothetical protein